MPSYRDLTDQELTDKIAKYRAAIEEIDLDGATSVIAGEGRRQEFVRSNASHLRTTLDELQCEQRRRAPYDCENPRGRALGVVILP